jgi:hypothetical protein
MLAGVKVYLIEFADGEAIEVSGKRLDVVSRE